MKIAIHQPNFVPWFPFFQKMRSADVFVILGHCQFEKGKYQNRFKLGGAWYTMSVNHGLEPIVDKRYVTADQDWKLIKGRLPQYGRILDLFDSHIGASLHMTNVAIIQHLAALLGITTRIAFDQYSGLKATDRLVFLCQEHGADTYLAGQSGANYLEPEKFTEVGIKVEYQDLSKADKRHTLEVLNETV